ncbi:MAG TPA: primosomal protein N' [Vicinamibacteria bacterium]|nr:primosomal protein N' [Vicinamibacteria bacterium]
MDARAVEVALPLPLQCTFTYRLPEGAPVPARGVRVLVPFGPRRVIGLVTGIATTLPETMKDVVEVLDEVPLAPPPLLDLATWMSEHYLAPPGECHRLVLPPAGVRASRAVVRLSGGAVSPSDDDPVVSALRAGPLPLSTLAKRMGRDPTARIARLRREGRVEVDQDLARPGFRQLRIAVLTPAAADLKPRGRAQAEVLGRLTAAGGRAPVPHVLRDRPSLRGALDRLVEQGAIAIEEERAVRTPEMLEGPVKLRPEPTGDQASVLEPILAALGAGFAPFLLQGVTGSGKTEVYFRAIEQTLEQGRTALLLVPEIALTPLLVRAAVGRLGGIVSVLHSELSVGERHDQWWRLREGDARVAIGARSAVFAPLTEVGLVIVDEEHEAAYKQDESPRYHGRDVAVMRARLEGAVVLLGSATPSLESNHNALAGKYRRLVLPRRIGSQGMARVDVVDRRQALKAGADPILTPPLRDALAERLARKEQSLLLLNRRGYATSLLCRECGMQAMCPNCSVALTLHKGGRVALCHYCAFETSAPRACGSCKGEYLRLTGYGTEKVLEAVRAVLPTARVERLDRDLAARRGAVARVLASFEAGETDILVGTQMIAKGHDFPRVTLVGVVDADVGLGLPDFRAAERTFQLLTQVAGRAGRADLAGEVILQSHRPDHYALQLACAQDYDAFFEREMEFRRTMAYPPAATLVNLVLRARDPLEGAEAADAVAARLRGQARGNFRVLGPAFAPLARLRQEHRFQILLKGRRKAMRDAVREALVERYGSVRWPGVAVDVDPVTIM